jgi:hypothetical protein
MVRHGIRQRLKAEIGRAAAGRKAGFSRCCGPVTADLTQRRKAAKRQRGKPQPKNLNRRKRRKQRGKSFAENAEFSQIAPQGVSSFFASWRLCDFALDSSCGLWNGQWAAEPEPGFPLFPFPNFCFLLSTFPTKPNLRNEGQLSPKLRLIKPN